MLFVLKNRSHKNIQKRIAQKSRSENILTSEVAADRTAYMTLLTSVASAANSVDTQGRGALI